MSETKKTVVLIPCYNEEKTIAKVIQDFKKELPEAEVIVYDNNSKDNSNQIARETGATVYKENRQGKGYVVNAMFKDIMADTYLMVDGDDTYPAEEIHKLLAKFQEENLDMVIGDRLSNGSYAKENKRNFHGFGNKLVRFLINKLFRVKLKDIMSGYRVFSKSFVKNYPVLSAGFQLETDMTIFALDKKFKMAEVPIEFRDRPKGSISKLNTYSDGFKVIMTIFNLYRYYKPMMFFGMISLLFIILSLIAGTPVILEFIEMHYIYKVPSAILASAFGILAILFFVTGLILDAITRINRENFDLKIKS